MSPAAFSVERSVKVTNLQSSNLSNPTEFDQCSNAAGNAAN
jgi:hypothetical protein